MRDHPFLLLQQPGSRLPLTFRCLCCTCTFLCWGLSRASGHSQRPGRRESEHRALCCCEEQGLGQGDADLHVHPQQLQVARREDPGADLVLRPFPRSRALWQETMRFLHILLAVLLTILQVLPGKYQPCCPFLPPIGSFLPLSQSWEHSLMDLPAGTFTHSLREVRRVLSWWCVPYAPASPARSGQLPPLPTRDLDG